MKEFMNILGFSKMRKWDYTKEEKNTIILFSLTMLGILAASYIETL